MGTDSLGPANLMAIIQAIHLMSHDGQNTEGRTSQCSALTSRWSRDVIRDIDGQMLTRSVKQKKFDIDRIWWGPLD